MNVFIVSASGGRKPQFWAHFDTWGLPYRPLLPVRVKFRVIWQTQPVVVVVVVVMGDHTESRPQFVHNADRKQ